MNEISIICIIISVVVSCFAVYIYRSKTKSTIDKLNQMLDSAINGNFTETTYDESCLSALEEKLNRYLCNSSSSNKNLAKEKDSIKSLIADISHQTRTPIANILLYGELLGEQNQLTPECDLMVNQINTQSEKLDFLIQSLIKISRLETGIITVTPKPNSIDELILSVCDDVKAKAEKKHIDIETNLGDVYACFDRKWTEESLYNILDNAIKYTSSNGLITISSFSYELFCRIDILDNGIGIAEHEINSVFKRFYRSPAVNQYDGVGIGLYLSREIISAQNGYIKVTSEIGKGSMFSIFLPREK